MTGSGILSVETLGGRVMKKVIAMFLALVFSVFIADGCSFEIMGGNPAYAAPTGANTPSPNLGRLR